MLKQQLTQDPELQPSEYFFDYEYLQDVYADAKASYDSRDENKGKDYAVEIFNITDKFLNLSRYNYLKFGPYWWAVKHIMATRGFKGYGNDSVIILRDAYYVENPLTEEKDDIATIIAAWQFKDHYNATYIQGNRDFDLFPSGENYYLEDEEWEYAPRNK